MPREDAQATPAVGAQSVGVAELLGLAVYVISRRRCYLDYPIGSLVAWLLPPAQLGQLCIFRDRHSQVVGYMTWAFLTPETERTWLSESGGVWHISEWQEGVRLWIVDLVVSGGMLRECIRQAANVLGAYEEARYCRSARHKIPPPCMVIRRCASGRVTFARERRADERESAERSRSRLVGHTAK